MLPATVADSIDTRLTFVHPWSWWLALIDALWHALAAMLLGPAGIPPEVAFRHDR
jgi:hypothetical protein